MDHGSWFEAHFRLQLHLTPKRDLYLHFARMRACASARAIGPLDCADGDGDGAHIQMSDLSCIMLKVTSFYFLFYFVFFSAASTAMCERVWCMHIALHLIPFHRNRGTHTHTCFFDAIGGQWRDNAPKANNRTKSDGNRFVEGRFHDGTDQAPTTHYHYRNYHIEIRNSFSPIASIFCRSNKAIAQ